MLKNNPPQYTWFFTLLSPMLSTYYFTKPYGYASLEKIGKKGKMGRLITTINLYLFN